MSMKQYNWRELYSKFEEAINQRNIVVIEYLFDELKRELFNNCSYYSAPDWMIEELIELVPHKMRELSIREILNIIGELNYRDSFTPKTKTREFVVLCFLERLSEIGGDVDKEVLGKIKLPNKIIPLNLSVSGVDFVDVVLRAYKKVSVVLNVVALPTLAKKVSCEVFEDILANCKLAGAQETKFLNELPDEYFEIILKLIKEKRLNLGEYFVLPERIPQEFLDENPEAILKYTSIRLAKDYVLKKGLNKKFSLFAVEVAKNDYELIPELGKENFAALVNNSHPQHKTFYAMFLKNPHIKDHPRVFLKALRSYCELKTSSYYDLEIPDEILLKLTPRQVARLLEKNVDKDGESGLKMNPEILKQKIAVLTLACPDKVEPILEKLKLYEKWYKCYKSVGIICEFLGIPIDRYWIEVDENELRKIIKKIISIKEEEFREELFLFVVRYFGGISVPELARRFENLVQKILGRT